MPLNPLVIETDYFENIQNRAGFMKASDFDFQFNTITNYINSSIVPLLRQLVSDTIPGTQDPSKANTYLKNVGDGTTEWSKITFNDIPNLSLSFSQLLKTNPCSILAAGNDQIFKAVSATDNRQSLVSQDNDRPVWKKLTSANIKDRQITDAKIALGSLVKNNFQENLIAIKLTDNAVTTEKILDNTIPTAKLAPNAVTSNILGELITNQFAGRNGVTTVLWGNTLTDRIIRDPTFLTKSSSNFPNTGIKTFPIDHTKLAPDFKIHPLLYNKRATFRVVNPLLHPFEPQYINNVELGSVQGWQIKDNSIEGARLFYSGGQGYPYIYKTERPLSQMIAVGAIGIENLPPSYKAKLGL